MCDLLVRDRVGCRRESDCGAHHSCPLPRLRGLPVLGGCVDDAGGYVQVTVSVVQAPVPGVQVEWPASCPCAGWRGFGAYLRSTSEHIES